MKLFLAYHACSAQTTIVEMADEEKRIGSQSKAAKDNTRPPAAGGKWSRIQRRGILHVVGVLLLLFVLRILIRGTVVSKSRACSWFHSLLDRPRFPFPRRRMSIQEREELFL